jgi:hypothetical protein
METREFILGVIVNYSDGVMYLTFTRRGIWSILPYGRNLQTFLKNLLRPKYFGPVLWSVSYWLCGSCVCCPDPCVCVVFMPRPYESLVNFCCTTWHHTQEGSVERGVRQLRGTCILSWRLNRSWMLTSGGIWTCEYVTRCTSDYLVFELRTFCSISKRPLCIFSGIPKRTLCIFSGIPKRTLYIFWYS